MYRNAGAANEHRAVCEARLGRPVVLEVGERRVAFGNLKPRRCLKNRARDWTLHSDERHLVAAIGDSDVEGCRALEQRGNHGEAVARVSHHEVLGLAGSATLTGGIDDEVVDDAAGLVEQQAVFCLHRRDCREFASKRKVEERTGVRAGHSDFGHVGDVKDSGGCAHGVVLGEVGAVTHGHLPTGKVGERRTQRDVNVVEGRISG